MPCLVRQRVCFVRQISVMKCLTFTGFKHYLYWPNRGVIGPKILIKLVLSSYQGKEKVFGETDICLKHFKLCRFVLIKICHLIQADRTSDRHTGVKKRITLQFVAENLATFKCFLMILWSVKIKGE